MLTDEKLATIEERVRSALMDVLPSTSALMLVREDIPALVAEVRSLRAAGREVAESISYEDRGMGRFTLRVADSDRLKAAMDTLLAVNPVSGEEGGRS